MSVSTAMPVTQKAEHPAGIYGIVVCLSLWRSESEAHMGDME